MDSLSIEDRCNLIIASGKGEGHAKLCYDFNQNHPEIVINTYDIANLLRRFFKNGSVLSKAERKQEFTKDSKFEQNEIDQVHNIIDENPHTSVSRSSLMTGISRSKTYKILKTNKFHPYKLQYLQELQPTDFTQRLNMCHWFQHKISTSPNFVRRCCFSDEAGFTLNGVINKQNLRLWSDENEHWYVCIF